MYSNKFDIKKSLIYNYYKENDNIKLNQIMDEWSEHIAMYDPYEKIYILMPSDYFNIYENNVFAELYKNIIKNDMLDIIYHIFEIIIFRNLEIEKVNDICELWNVVVEYNRYDILEKYLELVFMTDTYDIASKNTHIRYILFYAIHKNNDKIFKFIIRKGIPIIPEIIVCLCESSDKIIDFIVKQELGSFHRLILEYVCMLYGNVDHIKKIIDRNIDRGLGLNVSKLLYNKNFMSSLCKLSVNNFQYLFDSGLDINLIDKTLLYKYTIINDNTKLMDHLNDIGIFSNEHDNYVMIRDSEIWIPLLNYDYDICSLKKDLQTDHPLIKIIEKKNIDKVFIIDYLINQ